MKIKFVLVIVLVIMTIPIMTYAQSRIIEGKVISMDDGAGLPGVSILHKNGTLHGTVTDFNGDFSIEVDDGSILMFSFIGFIKKEVVVGAEATITVILEPDTTTLDEVVVVGYGVQRKRDLTSAITIVESEEIEKSTVGQAMQALQGKVAGMQVVSTGVPGDQPTVRIRGLGSFEDGAQAPLYVVDGMLFGNIDFLNPSEIKSISVLKDASAAAVYGVRAANGVVLIETKSGSFSQKAKISYSGYYGIQRAQNILKMANSEQFAAMAYESGSVADSLYVLNAMQRYGRHPNNPNVPNVNTDWYDEVLKLAPIQNHALNISGGSDVAAYLVGGSYFVQEGLLNMENQYERFNLRTKADLKATDWLTVGGNMLFSQSSNQLQDGSAWESTYFAVPTMPVFDESNYGATPIMFANARDLGYRNAQNPFIGMNYNSNRLKIYKTILNSYAKFYAFDEKLSFKTSYNHEFAQLSSRGIGFPYYLDDETQRELSSINRKEEHFTNQIWDNLLTYSDQFGKHSVTVLGGFSYRNEQNRLLEARGDDFDITQQNAWYIDEVRQPTTDQPRDNGRQYFGISYLTRLAYNYADKYLLYATVRTDGSNKYDDKWATFPTLGMGWVISEERFLNGSDVFSFLKLRASWGKLGNDKLQASDGSASVDDVELAVGDELRIGTVANNTFSQLKWEITEEMNFGLSSRFFRDRLTLELDYYQRETQNAQVDVIVPGTTSFVKQNGGAIKNSGLELTLDWYQEFSSGLSILVGANATTLSNEVVSLGGQSYLDQGMAEFRQRNIIGQPIKAFFGLEVEGVYQNQEAIDADQIAVDNGLAPGDFKFKDQNADGIIDGQDRVVLGSYLPDFMYGANVEINYKKFELSINVMGQRGNKILNRKRGEIIWTNDQNMDADLAINRWHGEGTSNKYPSSAGLRKGWNQAMSSYFVEDGSFFRVQTVQLAYNLISAGRMPDLRFSLTADRPLTVFNYNGFSPEVPGGIDQRVAPIPATYTAGVSLKF